MQPERIIQNQICDWLYKSGNWYRVNDQHGGGKGTYKRSKHHKLGEADLWVSIPVFRGLFQDVYIEVKTPTGKQSPEQKEFQAEAERRGYKYLLVHSYEEFIQKFNEMGLL